MVACTRFDLPLVLSADGSTYRFMPLEEESRVKQHNIIERKRSILVATRM
jgi:hypothetical protein